MDSTKFPIFDLKQLEIIEEENGNKYYIIPVGTKIYRGGFPADMHPNAFFGFNPDHVKQYGSVTEYTIKENLKVLAIMEMNNTSDFYKSATPAPDIQNALNESYSYSNDEKIRDSIPAYDYAVVNHICDNTTYHGYAMHDSYKTESGGIFHAELVICDCYDKVEQGAKGEQAPPRVMRKVKQTNFYVVEQKKEENNSPVNTLQQGKSLFYSPLGDGKTKEIDGSPSNKKSVFNGFIPFDLSSPNTTKSPLKEKLDEDDDKVRSMLFGSPQQDPEKLRITYTHQGLKDPIARKLDLGGGKRKTKRRNRKTKNKTKRRKTRTKRRRNRRTKKVKH